MAKLVTQIEEARADLRRLEAEQKEIVYESTESRLERNRVARMKARLRLTELEQEASTVKSSAEPSPRERELVELVKRRRIEELEILRGVRGGVPQRYIEHDESYWHQKLVVEADKRIEELWKPFKGHRQSVRPGGRVQDEINRLEYSKNDWPRIKKLCELGAKVRTIRGEREQLEAELQEVRNNREEAALAKA